MTQSTETWSSYLKEGLLRSHGRGLGMTSLTRTRNPSSAKYAAGRSQQQAQTPPTQESCETVRRESMDESPKSTVECSKQTLTHTLQEAFARGTPNGKESRRWKERTAAVTTYI